MCAPFSCQWSTLFLIPRIDTKRSSFPYAAAMRIIGLGVDLAEIDRVERLLGKYDQFPGRVFTEHERGYASRFANPARRYAARFAGKEAVMKSMGTGWRRIRWQDVEITGGGAPRVNLYGTAKARAATKTNRGSRSWVPLAASWTGRLPSLGCLETTRWC